MPVTGRRDPEPTEADVRAWRRLVKRASAAAAAPLASAGELFAAVQGARRAVYPVGPYRLADGRDDPDNAFARLGKASRHWCEARAERVKRAAELRELAAACAALLSAEPAAPPVRRFRADIDG